MKKVRLRLDPISSKVDADVYRYFCFVYLAIISRLRSNLDETKTFFHEEVRDSIVERVVLSVGARAAEGASRRKSKSKLVFLRSIHPEFSMLKHRKLISGSYLLTRLPRFFLWSFRLQRFQYSIWALSRAWCYFGQRGKLQEVASLKALRTTQYSSTGSSVALSVILICRN